jgi:hypothetical protein
VQKQIKENDTGKALCVMNRGGSKHMHVFKHTRDENNALKKTCTPHIINTKSSVLVYHSEDVCTHISRVSCDTHTRDHLLVSHLFLKTQLVHLLLLVFSFFAILSCGERCLRVRSFFFLSPSFRSSTTLT